ncbi:hypothetical protein DFH08DRAFT_350056 [Mycena albidolilacea]|uniref:Uncharacterized protein n=1 Tax=Mycena albidolilacea TaxID=1033008 RepID=A0AAD6ZHG9_9AGAR|nr:hypothetical protein DFH08DRAFT_350056 [Mycena albidolilacea]
MHTDIVLAGTGPAPSAGGVGVGRSMYEGAGAATGAGEGRGGDLRTSGAGSVIGLHRAEEGESPRPAVSRGARILACKDDQTPRTLFQAFSFPNLKDLVLNGNAWAPSILQGPYDRSRFKLSSLSLGVLDLSSHDLIEFLGRLLTLRELDLRYCGIDDDLMAFTFDSTSPSPRLIRPNLKEISIP